jgi:O-antigen ligase
LCTFYFSLEVIGEALKYITPFLLFFYLRHFIQSRNDLLGILQAFLYSFIIPFGVMIYENIFSPVAVEYVSEGRGGGSRIRGGYADVMSYAIFIVGFFLISAYYYLLGIYDAKTKKVPISKILWVIALCVLGLVSIKQVSTWAVFVGLFVLFLLSSATNRKGIILFLLITLLVLPFFAADIYDSQIQPLIEKEFAVINGEKDVEYALNGRVGRWEYYLSIWKSTPLVSRLFGVALSGIDETPIMVGGGIHNDFIRIMFLSGLIGVMLYLVFLIMMFRARRHSRTPERFLIVGAVLCLLLHSMSALPTLYASYIYLLTTVFAFASLPYAAKYGSPAKINQERRDVDQRAIAMVHPEIQ